MTVRFSYVTLFYYNQNTLPHSFLTQLAFKQAETSKQCLVCKIQPLSLLRRYKHSTRIFFSFLVEALKLQQSPCQEAQPHCPNIPVCARASCERTSRWMRPGLCDVRRSRLRRTPRLQLHYSTPHKGRARAFMTCRSGIQNDTVERVSIRIQLGRGGSRIRFALWEKWIRECAFPADGYKFCMIYYYIFISTLRQGGINGRTDGATLVCFHWEEEHRYYSCKRLRDCSFNSVAVWLPAVLPKPLFSQCSSGQFWM